jgi:hypothetical protein
VDAQAIAVQRRSGDDCGVWLWEGSAVDWHAALERIVEITTSAALHGVSHGIVLILSSGEARLASDLHSLSEDETWQVLGRIGIDRIVCIGLPVHTTAALRQAALHSREIATSVARNLEGLWASSHAIGAVSRLAAVLWLFWEVEHAVS